MTAVFGGLRPFVGLGPAIGEFARAAKVKCETLQTDPAIFEAWSAFVTAGERLLAFQPVGSQRASIDERLQMSQGLQLIAAGKELVTHVTRARVPMPKSTREYLDRVERYRAAWAPRPVGRDGAESMAARWSSARRPRTKRGRARSDGYGWAGARGLGGGAVGVRGAVRGLCAAVAASVWPSASTSSIVVRSLPPVSSGLTPAGRSQGTSTAAAGPRSPRSCSARTSARSA